MEVPELPEEGSQEADSLEKLNAYAYLTKTPERATYFAIMRVFCATLLADLSAHEVAERMSGDLPVETVASRLERLRRDGNLITSSRPMRVASIREYQRARARYQLSPLGERVQRQAEEIIASADAAREVSRELLALVARGLAELAKLETAPGGVEPRDALERISTLFAQFGQFAESVRDFYAYLGQVIFRYDLDDVEFAGFKDLLLDYAETITEDVAFHAPQIEASLTELWPMLPGLLARIDMAEAGLSALRQADVVVERSRGRDLGDWDGLRAWFLDESGAGSQVDQLRNATLRALQALLANAKRIIRSSTGELSRRRDLLRLAGWFDQSDEATAHDLFVAAFGLYGCRHLGIALPSDQDVPAVTSWRSAPRAPVPVALRDRGSRAPRGRTAPAEDYAEQRDRLLLAAAEEERRRRSAAAELRAAASGLARVRLSAAATRLLLDMVARALATASPDFTAVVATDEDLDLAIKVLAMPGHETLIRGADGDLTLDGLTVTIRAAAEPLADSATEETA
jgi:uncharacterized protein (TIGR02677 family)